MSATNKQDEAQSSTTGQFVAALVTGAIVVGALTAVWLVLHGRKSLKKVYQPRSELAVEGKKPPVLPSSPVGFWKTVFGIPDEQIIVENGLDAYFFNRFIKIFGVYMLIPYVLLTCSVCIGVSASTPNQGLTGLNKLTFGNVAANQQDRHVAHFLVAIILLSWTLYLLWKEFNHFVEQRQKWLSSPQHLTLARSRTVAITNVPDAINSETGLKELAGQISTLTGQSNGSAPRISDATAVGGVPHQKNSGAVDGVQSDVGGVRNVWLSRQVKDVEKIWEERDKECARLEGAVAKMTRTAVKNYKKGKTPEKKGTYDAEKSTHMVERFIKKQPTWKQGLLGLIGQKQTLETSPVYIREHNEQLEAMRAKEYPQGNTAFVRFGSQAQAHAFARLASSTKGNKLIKASVEVVPEDIYWKNMSMNAHMRRIRTIISWALTIGLMIIWAPLITFVGLVSNVDSLCQKASWLAWLCKIPAPALGIIKGVLPPVLLAVLFMLLPPFLRMLVRLQGEILDSEIELKVYSRYWLFQIIHGFLIVTLAAGLINALSNLGSTANSVPSLLANKLPGASIFFLTFVLTATFSSAAKSYSRAVPTVMYGLRGILGGKTPRKFYLSEFKMGSISFATAWPPMTLLLVICMTYSVIQPIMTLLTFLAMLVLYAAWRYTFAFVVDQEDRLETGGQFYIKALHGIFCGLYIEFICLAGLFFLSTDSTGGRSKSGLGCGVILIICIIGIALFQIWLDHFRFKKAHLLFVHAATTRKTDGSIPDQEQEFANAGPEHGNTSGFHEHAFDHPAMWKKQPVIWNWDDTLGIGKFETARINEAGVEASTEYNHLDADGKMFVERSAPDEAWYGGHSA